jgi:hypothetical protein
MDKLSSFLKNEKADDSISIKTEDQEEAIGIQKSFVTQFAENQNHHQRLFIQFLSSVLVVIIAYAYVYSNTASYEGIKIYKTTFTDSSSINKLGPADSSYSRMVISVLPDKFNSSKYENGSIISYSQFSLLSIYIFAQIVLLVLSIMILHMGYSYRRDQCVVSKIRKINLGLTTYEKIYGIKNYSGTGKGFLEYLPNFNSILFFSIFVIQAGLFISIFIYLNKYGADVFYKIGETYITPPYTIRYNDLSTSLFFPLLINLFIYTYYYNKYEFTVNKKDTYVPRIIEMLNKPRTFIIYSFVILLSIAILVFSFYKIDRYIHLWTFIYFYLIILLPILFYLAIKKNTKAWYFSQLFLGVIYIACGITLFYHSYYYFERHNLYTIQNNKQSIYLVLASVLVFMTANWFGVWITKKEETISKYLKGYNRFLFVLLYAFLIVYFMELKWLDYSVSCFFAIYSFLIGRRTVLKWRRGEYLRA